MTKVTSKTITEWSEVQSWVNSTNPARPFEVLTNAEQLAARAEYRATLAENARWVLQSLFNDVMHDLTVGGKEDRALVCRWLEHKDRTGLRRMRVLWAKEPRLVAYVDRALAIRYPAQ